MGAGGHRLSAGGSRSQAAVSCTSLQRQIPVSSMLFLKKTLAIGTALLIAATTSISPSLAVEQDVSIGEMLRRELPEKTKSAVFVVYLFSHDLNSSIGRIPPASALNSDYFQRLSLEINRLIKASEDKDEKQILGDVGFRKELQYLVGKVRAVADPNITGVCQGLGIDLKTAKESRGDWRLVKAGNEPSEGKQAVGVPIKPSSFLHIKLYWYYRLGCGGKKDLETARRVLFEISDLEPVSLRERSDLRAEFRHCEAETWAKYGIGGPVDLVRAEQFSKRYTKATFLLENEDTPEIRAEMTAQFPDAAKRNFGCPRADYYRDPRDPWLRLW